MISKAKLKYIHSLQTKKGRNTENSFVAEGPKVVKDLLAVFQPELIVATADWLCENEQLIQNERFALHSDQIIEVSQEELSKVSFLQHPQEVLVVLKQKHSSDYFTVTQHGPESKEEAFDYAKELILALDGVQDPGNLGTIIRIADWFGIEQIICSEDTADMYNPKVVQATMGSLARVNLMYTKLTDFLDYLPDHTPVYGTLLDGKNIYEETLTEHGVIVMGNEGNGISSEVRERINRRLFIPNFPKDRVTAESLNVATAAAITCSEFRRLK